MTPWPPPPLFNLTSPAALLLPRASSCTLTPAASAFSAILAAFIGSLINGLASGWVVALATGWIAWLAVFRVLLGATYMLWHSVRDTWGPPPSPSPSPSTSSLGGDNIPLAPNPPPEPSFPFLPPAAALNPFSQHSRNARRALRAQQTATRRAIFSLASLWPSPAVVRGAAAPESPPPAHWAANPLTKPPPMLDRSVTALGWFSWGYTAVFAPITQILFLANNWSREGTGAAKIVRGLTVAVTALPLCVDVRVRYGERGGRGRGWVRRGFNVVTGGSCLVQGVFCALLLGKGVGDMGGFERGGNGGFGFLTVAVPVYCFFATVWAVVSCQALPMRDGGRKGGDHRGVVLGYVKGLAAGAFAGVFLAMPAMMLYLGAGGRSGPGGAAELSMYLSCESEVWRKLSAVLP